MGSTHVRMALLLLDLCNPRVQLHQALYCCFLAPSDAADQLQMGIARRTRYAFI